MFELIPLILFAQIALADLTDYTNNKCLSVNGWEVIQKISGNSYLVEFSTSKYSGDDCIRNSSIPGGCIAVAILKTLKPFSSSGQITERIHVKQAKEKIKLKKDDGFEKSYQVFQEDANCGDLLKKANKVAAQKDPVYDCKMNGNAESCYSAGKKILKDADYLSITWHKGRDLIEKACNKGHKLACPELEKLKTSSDF